MTDIDDATVLVAGETLVDFLPGSVGPISTVEQFSRRAGGAPANVAVALTKLDETPLFWTRVGEDPFGEFLVETLRDHGVSQDYVERDPAAKTSLAFVSHDDDAERGFSFYRDDTADTRMEPGRVPDATLADVEWVHVGGVTLAAGRSREATEDLVARAAGADCTVSFDPNARPELWESDAAFREVAGDALDAADVVKATAAELRALGIEGDSPAALARAACERGPHTVLLTLGGEGALAVATDDAPDPGTERHGGYVVDPVDTTGAGDAFTAGAIASLVAGEDLAETLAFANAVAATATTGEGAMTALPDRDSVAAFRDDHEQA